MNENHNNYVLTNILSNVKHFSNSLSNWDVSNITDFSSFFNPTISRLLINEKECENLLLDLYHQDLKNYKCSFSKEENENIYKLIKSKDLYSIELAKQIILTKLNSESI